MAVIDVNKIVVLDKNKKTLCHLLERDGLIDVIIARQINGESSLSFSMPKTSEKFKHLYGVDIILVADGREYTLMKEQAIETSRDLDGSIYVQVNAVETWYLLNSKYVTAYNSKMLMSKVAFSMVNLLSKSAEPLNVNDKVVTSRYAVGTAGYALQALLWDSGWSVDVADDTGQKYDVITDKKTILENIMEVQKLWGGMLFWDSKKKTVSLRSETAYVPYNGYQIKYGANLQEITRQQNNSIVTRLIPRGNNYLSILAVNGNKRYLEDYSYSSIVYEREVINADIYDQTVLLNWGKEQLKKLCKPQYQYTISTLDLNKLINDKNHSIELGNMVDVIDKQIVANNSGIERLRIVKYSYDMFIPVRCQVEIGDKIGAFEQTFRDLTKKANNSDDLISGDGTIGGDHLDLEGNETFTNFEQETDTEFSNAYAAIQALTNETEASIMLLTQYTDKRFMETEASITLLSNQTESSITSLTSYVNTSLQTTTSTLRQEISNGDSASIYQAATYTDNRIGVVNNSIASIRQTVNSQGSSIDILSSTTNSQGRQIASISLRTDDNSSEITIQARQINLKADKTYVQNLVADKASISQLNSVNASINNLNASKASIYELNLVKGTVNNLIGGQSSFIRVNANTIYAQGSVTCSTVYTNSLRVGNRVYYEKSLFVIIEVKNGKGIGQTIRYLGN